MGFVKGGFVCGGKNSNVEGLLYQLVYMVVRHGLQIHQERGYMCWKLQCQERG